MWTEEKTELLKKLWAEGLSASQVGAIIGETRNAVVGKVWRLKLKNHPSSSTMIRAAIARKPRPPKPPRERKPKAKPVLKFGAVHKPLAVKTISFTAGPWEPLPGRAPIPLVDLAAGQCKWPLGDPLEPGFGFCGCDVEEGRPYCAEHYARSVGKGTASEQAAIKDAEKIAA